MATVQNNLNNDEQLISLSAQSVQPSVPTTQPAVKSNPLLSSPVPSTTLMINLQQTLENVLPTQTRATVGATDNPSTPVLTTPATLYFSMLQQSLNNKQQDKVETPTPIQGAGTINGLPEGDYAALSFALSVSAGALSAVSEKIGLNSSQISVMNAIMGQGMEAIYQENMQQAQETLNKESEKTRTDRIFGQIKQHLGQVASAAIIVAGLITCDPALVAVGCVLLAMSISVVSSHLTEGIAAGLMQIPGMEGRETLAQGIATGLVLAATITVCLLVGNVAGAEEAIGEGVAEIAAEGGEAAFTDTGEALDTAVEAGAGAADMGSASSNLAESSARIGTQMLESGIESGEKTMVDLVQETVNSMLQFIQENPQQLLDAVKKGSTAGQAVAALGQAVVQGQLAKLSVQYGQAQATIQGLDFNFNTLSERNQSNMSFYADIEKSNAKMVNNAFNSAAEAGFAYANILG